MQLSRQQHWNFDLYSDPVMSSGLSKVNNSPQMIVYETSTQVVVYKELERLMFSLSTCMSVLSKNFFDCIDLRVRVVGKEPVHSLHVVWECPNRDPCLRFVVSMVETFFGVLVP